MVYFWLYYCSSLIPWVCVLPWVTGLSGVSIWYVCMRCAGASSGEHWLFCPSELASPRRDEQRLAQGFLRKSSLRWPNPRFEQANVSLRRRGSRLSKIAQGLLSSLSSSRLGGGELVWAKVILSWARPSSLSEDLGEDASPVVFPFVLGCLNCAYMGYCMMV